MMVSERRDLLATICILIKKWFNMSCDVLHTLEMKPKIMTQLDSFPDNTPNELLSLH